MGFGFSNFNFDRPEGAELSMDDLWNDTRADKNITARMHALTEIATRLAEEGEQWKAIGAAEAAMELFKQLDEALSLAHGNFFLGEQYFALEKYEEARKLFGYAETEFENLINDEGRAESLKMLGYSNRELKNLDVALECLRQAAEIFVDQAQYTTAGILTLDIGQLQQQKGAFEVALNVYEKALEQFQSADDLIGSGRYHLATAEALDMLERLEESKQHIEDGLQIFEFINHAWFTNVSKFRLGRILGEMGQYEEALALLTDAAEVNRKHGHHLREAAFCELERAKVLRLAGRFQESRQILKQLKAVFEGVGEPTFAIDAELQQAKILRAEGAFWEAEEILAKNLTSILESDNPGLASSLVICLAESYSDSGRHEEALNLIESQPALTIGLNLKKQVAWNNCHARALIGLQRLADARPFLEKAVAVDVGPYGVASTARTYELLSMALEPGQQEAALGFRAAAISLYLKAGEPATAFRLAKPMEPKGPHSALEALRTADGQLSFFADLNEYRQAS
jgi:tetratricopeptide (TPR) repeat protein